MDALDQIGINTTIAGLNGKDFDSLRQFLNMTETLEGQQPGTGKQSANKRTRGTTRPQA